MLRNAATPEKHQIETMPGGVAVFDYDNDGYPDIYFTNGAEQPSLEKTGPQYRNRLYRNRHDWTFEDVTAKAGVGGAGYNIGVAAADYDNDGYRRPVRHRRQRQHPLPQSRRRHLRGRDPRSRPGEP